MSTKVEESQALIDELLEVYPEKTKKFRKKHFQIADEETIESGKCSIKSNIKSRPGVMTIRGCAYAGSKGVVWGPIKDMIHISHGPVGCGQYSWGTRRNYANGKLGINNFTAMQITSDFQERDIVFGGDKKLEALCREVKEMFPLAKGISIQSECPVGLIGDDIEAVGKKMTNELGIPVIPVRCEGFRGVSQSLGHHIANDTIRDHVMGTRELAESGPYDVAIIGDYNIGGDAWASRILLEEIGLRVIAQWSGDGSINELGITHKSKLNLIHCYRSMNYMATTLEEKYGIPWMEYNFFGPTKTIESLRAIAAHFDETIQENAERVIAKYQLEMDEIIQKYRPRLEGKKVMLIIGGLRARHTIGAYEDLGMKIVATGYEFAHKDDYEKTLSELHDGTILYDDPTAYDIEFLSDKLDIDLMGAGVKEKYVYHKLGIPFRQMHSWDYSGPYHGFDGFKVFAKDMDTAINSPVWDLLAAPY
ncbi:nitrogenase molybdenum-iron protein alpha chain [Niallia sp. Sow4_A1]|uniref:Nitrogenase protein alpha chain n=1 Tax=Niallia hominis TaxID=3133173 RepID=A0ABV1F3U7_9BACI|nr:MULTISPECIES: nitrogenase molybdenum-iron protein alpha chain [Bacillaceae]MCF2647512.1 nitrogenase molybdenum-iron protein alpha chain [Niallia circulans]CAI9388998.1 Nitrogenase molybdenum-iron protein alpha chain [Bacillus sp. T2.9-1]